MVLLKFNNVTIREMITDNNRMIELLNLLFESLSSEAEYIHKN